MSNMNISPTPTSLVDETPAHHNSPLMSNTDESVQRSGEFVLGDETTAHRTGSKRKRARLYIHVEDLISYVKKRCTNMHGSLPQVPQLPGAPQPEQIPPGSVPVNPNLAMGSATMERGPQVLDAHSQNQFEISNSETATGQSSDVSDSNSDGNDDSSDDNEDDDDLLDEVDLPSHKLELFHILGLDTSNLVQHTTDSSSGSGSGSGSGNSNTVGSSRATPSSITTGSFGWLTPGSHAGTAKETKSLEDNVVAVGSSGTPPKLVFGPLELRCWHAANGFRCPGKTGTSPDDRHLLEYIVSCAQPSIYKN